MGFTDKEVTVAVHSCLAHADYPTTHIQCYKRTTRVKYRMEDKEATHRYNKLPLEGSGNNEDIMGIDTQIKMIRNNCLLEEGPTREVYKYPTPPREEGSTNFRKKEIWFRREKL